VLEATTPPYLKHVATLLCEMFLLKNRHGAEMSEANCHTRLSRSTQLLKNIRIVTLASFDSLVSI